MTQRLLTMTLASLMALSLGCASRSVSDPPISGSTYVSRSEPELSITFDPSYVYVGEYAKTITCGKEGRDTRRGHVFVVSGRDKRVEASVAIERRTRTKVRDFPPIPFEYRDQSSAGIMNIDNVYYQVRTVAGRQDGSETVSSFLASKGYKFAESILVFEIIRHVGPKEVFTIAFAKRIDDPDRYNDYNLSVADSAGLRKFIDETFDSFSIKTPGNPDPTVCIQQVFNPAPGEYDENGLPTTQIP